MSSVNFEERSMKMKVSWIFLFLGVVFLFIGSPVTAQDAVQVDSKHYKVEFENDQVRVLRITYGPHEKSNMHDHPDAVAVSLTGQSVKFTLADGKSEEREMKAGQTLWTPATKPLPENLSDHAMEVILVELKKK